MALNYTAPSFSGGIPSGIALSNAFADIETVLRDVVSRSGQLPNAMEADLDMNGHDLLNVGGVDGRLLTAEDIEELQRTVGILDSRAALNSALINRNEDDIKALDARIDVLDNVDLAEDLTNRMDSLETTQATQNSSIGSINGRVFDSAIDIAALQVAVAAIEAAGVGGGGDVTTAQLNAVLAAQDARDDAQDLVIAGNKAFADAQPAINAAQAAEIQALKDFDAALTDASTKQLILARNAPADGDIPQEVLDLTGTDAEPLDKAVVKFIDYLIFYQIDGTWSQGPRVEVSGKYVRFGSDQDKLDADTTTPHIFYVSDEALEELNGTFIQGPGFSEKIGGYVAEKLNPAHLKRNTTGVIEQVAGPYDPVKAAANGYLPNEWVQSLANGLWYQLNTEAALRAATGDAAATIDQTVLPESGDGSLSAMWTRVAEPTVEPVRTVPTIAALKAVTDMADGDVYYVEGYTLKGQGDGHYKYDENSTENTLQFVGETSDSGVGRWVRVMGSDEAVTPYMYGALFGPDADSTEGLYQWSRRIGKINRRFVCYGPHATTETILIDARDAYIEIGLSASAGEDAAGIVYKGPNGGGNEPENTKPIILFYQCNRLTIPRAVVTCYHDDVLREHITGYMFIGQDSSQRGYGTLGNLRANGCEYSHVVGLSSRPESTFTDNINGADWKYREAGTYNDDVFENWHIQELRGSNCAKLHIDARTSDGTYITKLTNFPYNPGGSSPDFGVFEHSICLEQSGTVVIGEIQALQNDLGDLSALVDYDATVDTQVQAAAHGLSVGDPVYFPPSKAWEAPLHTYDTASPDFSNFYYVITATADTFEVAKTAGGAAVSMSIGTGVGRVVRATATAAAIIQRSGTLHCDVINCEGTKALTYYNPNNSAGRGGNNIGSIQSPDLTHNVNGDCVITNTHLYIGKAQIGGNIKVTEGYVGPVTFNVNPVTGEKYRVKSAKKNGNGIIGEIAQSYEQDNSDLKPMANSAYCVGKNDGAVPSEIPDVIEMISSRTDQTDTNNDQNIRVADSSIFTVDGYAIVKPDAGGANHSLIDENRAYKIERIVNATNIRFINPTDPSQGSLENILSDGTGARFAFPAVPIWGLRLKGDLSHRLKLVVDIAEAHGSSTAVGSSRIAQYACDLLTTNQLVSSGLSAAEYGLTINNPVVSQDMTIGNTETSTDGAWSFSLSPELGYVDLVFCLYSFNSFGHAKNIKASAKVSGFTGTVPISDIHGHTAIEFGPAAEVMTFA